MRKRKYPVGRYILLAGLVIALAWLIAPFGDPERASSLMASPSLHVQRARAGDVWAWGNNAYGQTGTGDTRPSHPFPAWIPGLSGVTAISAAGYHALALRRDGTVVAWGNDANQPGYPPLSYQRFLSNTPVFASHRPMLIQGLADIAAIAAGHDFGLAVRTDGRVFAFGHNGAGQLGDGTTTARRKPVMVHGLSHIVAIAAGFIHGLALDRDGVVYAWGRNDNGQLGDGTTTDRHMPVRMRGLSDVVAIAAGSNQSLAVRRDGRVYAWGADAVITPQKAPLPPDGRRRLRPTLVPGLTNVVAVAIGDSPTYDWFTFCLALTRNGTIIGWGDNEWGQLGHWATTYAYGVQPPEPVHGLPRAIAIAAGLGTSYALAPDGAIWTWGLNSEYEQGLQPGGLFFSRVSPMPRRVPIVPPARAIAAGRDGAFALVSPPGRPAEVAATATADVQNYRAAVTAQAVAADNATAVARAVATARATGPLPVSTLQPSGAVTVLGRPPHRLPPLPPSALAAPLRCSGDDLDVGPHRVMVLGGVHHYRHVCVHGGGILVAATNLTLEAQTISIDAHSQLSADGTAGSSAVPTRKGCPPGRTTQHPGHPGTGTTLDDATDNGLVGYAGLGGGTVTLVAHRIIVQGRLSAAGSAGQQGLGNQCNDEGCAGTSADGGGGGDGGAIRLVATEVDLTGAISTRGGDGAPAAEPVGNQYGTIARGKDGLPGADGCTKLFAATLRVPPGRLHVAGSLVLGQPLPSDPVPPTSGPDRLYVPATGHILSGPFLRFWQRFGGLAAFGQPETEAFTDSGRLVQYTDRALLVLSAGRVQLAPLGRLLTAGRAFPRVVPLPSTATRLYVAPTGHTLSGRFLAYWRTHHGATLLGAPISEVLVEGNGDGSGRRYQLQWFENGRLEYHPEHAGTPFTMQLGLVGVQALERRGWLP